MKLGEIQRNTLYTIVCLVISVVSKTTEAREITEREREKGKMIAACNDRRQINREKREENFQFQIVSYRLNKAVFEEEEENRTRTIYQLFFLLAQRCQEEIYSAENVGKLGRKKVSFTFFFFFFCQIA